MYEGIKQVFERYAKYSIFLLLAVLLASLFNNVKKVKEAKDRVELVKDRVEQLRKENDELKKNLEKVQSQEFLDTQLRDELGYVKEGEIVVVLPEDTEFLKNLAPEVKNTQTVMPDPNWKKWLKLFI